MTTIPHGETATAQRAPLPLTGYALGAAGAILFAAKGVIIKLAYAEGVDTETLLALRMGFALPCYLVVGAIALAAARRSGEGLPSRSTVLKVAGVGVLGYWFSSYMDFLGLQYISASFERLILFTYPLFVVLFGALWFRQPVRPRALIAFVASYSGLAVIFLQSFSAIGQDATRGALFVMMSAISFALYQLFARNLLSRIGSALFTCIAMTSASVLAIGQFSLVRPMEALMVSPRVLGLSLAIAIGSTVLPTFLMNAALRRISAQANSTISTISPVITMALAVVILGEQVTAAEIVGGLLVLGSIGWFTLVDSRRRR